MKATASTFALSLALSALAPATAQNLWSVYNNTLKDAKYVDLTHAFHPAQAVWPGFGNAKFKPSIAGRTFEGFAKEGDEFSYGTHGFVATAYELTTDQYGTQLDPPAHFSPLGATISDLPPTYAVRPLVVINIADKVAKDVNYHMTVADIAQWEKHHGRIPEGSVVMVRSDW
ncbi:MAG TPA: cyclase family protein, partial [Casimicrobium huifangae]|nr:cyclase family protein [Casimicrobium huifangae]